MQPTRTTSETIRDEADRLLGSGLMELLARHGEVQVTGSHALRLMTWRDLDIHVIREDASIDACFALGRDLARLLKPHRMHYRDETSVATPGLPKGRYWGIYLGDGNAGRWKIDIWMTDRATWEPTRAFVERIASRLNDRNRAIILAIKEACWRHPEYRRGFTSADVYAAVLDRGIADVAGFWSELESTKGISEHLIERGRA